MPNLRHEEHDTHSTNTTSTSSSLPHTHPETQTDTDIEPASAERVGDVREDGDTGPRVEDEQPSFLFRALSQAANALWLFSFRPRRLPTPLGSFTDSISSSGDDDENPASQEEGPMIPSALLSAVLNGPEPHQGDSPSDDGISILEKSGHGPEPSSSDDHDNDDGFAAQIRQIEAARTELQKSLAAGISRHATISRDIERATRALTVRSLELDNRSLELDTRESLCEIREARLGIDWVARTRRICERERAAAATVAELEARFSALETRQQQQDEVLKAEREHFWDIQRALSQVIANETDELLVEQQKLREDFEAKSMAAKNALLKMHHAVRTAASTIVKGANVHSNGNGNRNCIPKYLGDVAAETKRQFDNVNGIYTANGWNSNSVIASGIEGQQLRAGSHSANGMSAKRPPNRLSREGDSREMGLKRANEGGDACR